MMPDRVQVSDRVTVGSQPSIEELNSLAQQGFKSVINLRVQNEEAGMLSPLDEGDVVRRAGMAYLNLEVTGSQVRPEQVEEFRNAVQHLDSPIFVHCKSAQRAGAFALMDCGAANGWSGDEALRHGKRLGLQFQKPELAELVKQYLQR